MVNHFLVNLVFLSTKSSHGMTNVTCSFKLWKYVDLLFSKVTASVKVFHFIYNFIYIVI